MKCPKCGYHTLRLLSRNNITQVEKWICFNCKERVTVEPNFKLDENGELVFKDSETKGAV